MIEISLWAFWVLVAMATWGVMVTVESITRRW
jgi:hypothetical protein